MNAAKTEYFNKICASFTETAPEIEDLSAIEKTDTIQWFNRLLGEGQQVSFAEDMNFLAEVGLADAAEDERVDMILENFDVDEEWAEESSDDRREIYEEIKTASDSPFSLAWGMTLEKSWITSRNLND